MQRAANYLEQRPSRDLTANHAAFFLIAARLSAFPTPSISSSAAMSPVKDSSETSRGTNRHGLGSSTEICYGGEACTSTIGHCDHQAR